MPENEEHRGFADGETPADEPAAEVVTEVANENAKSAEEQEAENLELHRAKAQEMAAELRDLQSRLDLTETERDNVMAEVEEQAARIMEMESQYSEMAERLQHFEDQEQQRDATGPFQHEDGRLAMDHIMWILRECNNAHEQFGPELDWINASAGREEVRWHPDGAIYRQDTAVKEDYIRIAVMLECVTVVMWLQTYLGDRGHTAPTVRLVSDRLMEMVEKLEESFCVEEIQLFIESVEEFVKGYPTLAELDDPRGEEEESKLALARQRTAIETLDGLKARCQ